MTQPKQVLVVCYSLTGNTARIARELGKRLDADVEFIQEARSRTGFMAPVRATIDALRKVSSAIVWPKSDPARYRVTVIGTPVWAGTMTPAVRAYLSQTRGRMHNAAFFITSGYTNPEKVVPAMAVEARCEPFTYAGFNAPELHDGNLFESKLAAFVKEIERIPGVRIESATDHAA